MKKKPIIKRVIVELVKILGCALLTYVMMWIIFISFISITFNPPVAIFVLLLVGACITLSLYLAIWFWYISETYDLHNIEKRLDK